MTADINRGAPVPMRKCGIRCGHPASMAAFDALPRSLRNFFNDEVAISWCMCGALDYYRALGEAATLAHYRALERRYR
jgi:hypothetical protein